MRSLVESFKFIAPSVLLGCLAFSLLDTAHWWVVGYPLPPIGEMLSAAFLSAALCTTYGLILCLMFAAVLASVRRAAGLVGRELSIEGTARAVLQLGVAQSISGWRAWVVVVVLMAAGPAMGGVGALLAPFSGLNNVSLVVAYSIWATAGMVVPVLIVRLLLRNRPRYAPVDWATYLMLGGWAYLITWNHWRGASHETIWAAVAIGLLPTSGGVLLLLLRSARLRRAAEVTALVASIVAVVTVVVYPRASTGHAQMMKGMLAGIGSWQALSSLADLDGDGAPHVLGGRDCAPLDPEVGPNALEIVGNGIDDNCFGGDLVAAAIPSPPVSRPEYPRTRPPVVVITVDTLRADAVHKRVDGRAVTPVIDALLDGAVEFTSAYSTAGSTDDSVPALMSGMYPSDWHQDGVYFGVEPTLAELLKKAGYSTVATILMPWLRVALVYGFDVIDNSLGERHYRDERWLSSAAITELALKRLDELDQGSPFLLWVHYFDVHNPRFRIAGLEWLDDAYLQNAHIVDNQIGRLLRELEKRNILGRAAILFASDHGEGLNEHGIPTHALALWQSVVRVPLALRLPGVSPRKIRVPVSTVDMLPTMLHYLGITDEVPRDGRSLMPLVFGETLPDRPLFVENQREDRTAFFSVVDGDSKLIVDLIRCSYHLFDLSDDPEEARNLVGERPEEFERMMGLLGQWRDGIYNDVRLERKKAKWPERSNWKPVEFITSERSLKGGDAHMPAAE